MSEDEERDIPYYKKPYLKKTKTVKKGITSHTELDDVGETSHPDIDDIVHQLERGGVYVDRGDAAVYDFLVGDLTTDGVKHDLDLSGIIPLGTKAVLLKMNIVDNLTGKYISVFKKGYTGVNTAPIRTQAAGVITDGHFIVAVDNNRKCEYITSNTAFTGISILVTGWYL